MKKGGDKTVKRIIPAVIIIVAVISVCAFSHHFVCKSCDQTLNNVNLYRNREIDAETLKSNWKNQKDKLEFFVNHGLLDDISIYIGELTIEETLNEDDFFTTLNNIETSLELIKDEQKLALHSFY